VRKVKSYFFISLDGVVESPDNFDDEMGPAVSAGFASADALLMGRVLYEEWAAYWPEHGDEPFGDVMNSIKKVRSLQQLASGEVAEHGDHQRRRGPEADRHQGRERWGSY
jgi:dihydrofolate reductase